MRGAARERRVAVGLGGALLLLLGAAPALWAQPPGLEGPAVRTVPGSDPGAALAAAGGGWVGWSVPAIEGRELCCGSSRHAGRVCSLVGHDFIFDDDRSDRDDRRPGGEDRHLAIFVRAGGRAGAADDLRMVSEECRLETGGQQVTWIGEVPPEKSLALLAGLARAGRGLRSSAVAAIAFHRAAAADRLLEDLTAAGEDADLRRDAAFWLGEARGRAGFEALERLLASHPGRDLERHLTFVLTLSPVPEAGRRLEAMARGQGAPEVRSQALFWLAQRGDPGVEDLLFEILETADESHLREQGVFALSQLPDGRAVDALLRALTETTHQEVRRQALFWLAESDDPRALASIEALLER